jgi:hypothetical protein
MSEVIESAHRVRAPYYVVIAIPCGDQVDAGFAYDLATLTGSMAFNRRDVDLHIEMNKGTLLPSQRTGLVYAALALNATHILFLDSDMRFPPNLLHEMLEAKSPVVGVNYATRRFPIRPTAFLDELGEKRLYTTDESTGLVKVASMGLGATLIDMDVFRFVPQPWFPIEHYTKALPDGREGHFFVGEDINFFNKLRTAGIDVLVHQDLSKHIRHGGSWEYSHDHALVQREEVQSAEVASGPDHVVRDAASGSGIVVVER